MLEKIISKRTEVSCVDLSDLHSGNNNCPARKNPISKQFKKLSMRIIKIKQLSLVALFLVWGG